jgi:hypothetical protein
VSAIAAAAQAQGAPAAGGAQAASVPFLLASNVYTEAPFFSFTQQLGAAQISVLPTPNVTPGNFLDGITLRVTSTGGVLGAGVLTTDGVLAILNYISFVNTNGGEILYPMTSLEYVLAHKYLRPWRGDPQKFTTYSNTVNPAVTMELNIGVKDTLAILSNTDARAQYRLNLTLAPSTSVFSTPPTTLPTVTVTGWLNAWRQPPATDYAGRSIDPFPPGLGVQRKVMAQTVVMAASGTSRIRLTLTGDEIRGLILICRTSAGARQDLTDANAGPIMFRLDNGIQWIMLPSQILERMEAFYTAYFGAGNVNRETGVYVIPRFRTENGGDAWLPTVEQSYLELELGSADVPSGTIEVIYDQLAVGVPLPASLESI